MNNNNTAYSVNTRKKVDQAIYGPDSQKPESIHNRFK